MTNLCYTFDLNVFKCLSLWCQLVVGILADMTDGVLNGNKIYKEYYDNIIIS